MAQWTRPTVLLFMLPIMTMTGCGDENQGANPAVAPASGEDASKVVVADGVTFPKGN